jgi:hypothetical protein
MDARFHDPEWFVPRLTIVDREGKPSTLRNLTPEQRRFLRVFRDSKKDILVLKPRQMGMTTIVMACLFWRAYTAPDPVGILSIMHEHKACKRVNRMLRRFAVELPGFLAPLLDPDNADEIVFKHNGAGFQHLMAGGRGQGRSFTYQMLHCSEMGQWPRGSASTANSGEGADEDVWASALATMHDGPYKRRILEFTGDGPTGIGYKMVRTARSSPDWEFLFFRWFDFQHYAVDPPEDWERTDEEEELAALMAESLELSRSDPEIDRKLAWRRRKLLDEGYTLQRFRREYPSTWEEPFLLAKSAWFDGEMLNKVAGRLPPDAPGRAKPLRIYHQPEVGRRYFIGMDTSGGTNRDYAVICVLRDDFEVAAVWSSNTTKPVGQANECAKIAAMYAVKVRPSDPEPTRPVVLCEENNFGRAVIKRLERLGVRTWKDDRGRNFWTQGGRAGHTKAMVYANAQRLVDSGICLSADPQRDMGMNDAPTLSELIIIREDDRGNICAPEGQHDDHADAYVLALWCGRRYYEPAESTRLDNNTLKFRAAKRRKRK